MADEVVKKDTEDIKKEAESMIILGVFSMVIAAILFFAIIFTNGTPGRIANFSVGLILAVLGISIYLKGRKMGKGGIKKEGT